MTSVAPNSGPAFDGFEFNELSSRIGAAARLFILHLDTCADLMSHVGRNQDRIRKSPGEAAAAKRLASGVRQEIDALIGQVIEMVPTMVDELIDSLVPEGWAQEERVSGGRHHPVSNEEEAAILDFLGKRGLVRKIDKHFSKFRGDPVAITYIRSQFLQRAQRSPAEVLAASLLPSIVSAFEQYLSGLLRAGLSVYPKGLGALPDIPARAVDELASMEDLRRFQIDQKVQSVLKGGPADWRDAIRRWTKIDLMEQGADWLTICEAVERRHVVIHNDGRADADYLRRVDPTRRPNVVVGQPLRCSVEYLSDVMENMRVLGLVLAIRWAHHFGALEPLEVFPELVNDIYKLEELGRWSAAYIVCDTSIGLQANDDPLNDRLRVNWWLCRQHLGLDSREMVGDINAWTPEDLELQAARFALLEDDNALAQSIRNVLASLQAHGRRSFTEMVIWESAKKRSPEVRAAFAGKPVGGGRRRAKKKHRG